MVTLLRDHVAVTGQAPFIALAAASHPANGLVGETDTRRAPNALHLPLKTLF
jgi:hypothetical protein